MPTCPTPPVSLGFSWTTGSTYYSGKYYSAVPALPVGIIFALHGRGGTASLLVERRVEWASFFRDAVARRHAVVVLDAAPGSSTREWYTASTSVTYNPELVNMTNILSKMESAGLVTTTTPIYFVGIGQGGDAAGFLAAALSATRPVRAVAAYAAGTAAIYGSATYAMPTTFALSDKDPLVDRSIVTANVAAMKQRGVDAAVHVRPAERVCNGRFTRIPGISGTASRLVFDGLVAGGALAADGSVAYVSADAITWGSALPPQGIPPAYADFGEKIAEQLRVVGGENAFYGDRNGATLDFFDAHR